MNQDAESNDQRLTSLDAVYARVNVNSISAEHSKHAHVNIVEQAQVERIAEEKASWFWNNDHCRVEGSKVHHEQR